MFTAMFDGNTWKVTSPMPEFCAENPPENIAGTVPLPAVGLVCVMVSAKGMLEAPMPVPVTDTWKLPKLAKVGVFTVVDGVPRKVIVSEPVGLAKVIALVPPPEQVWFTPRIVQAKVPEVEKVTGSAFASEAPRATIARSTAPMIDV